MMVARRFSLGDPVVLCLGRPIADLTAAVEADGTLERMMGLTFVEPHLCPSPEVEVAQPVEDEDRSLDAADFAQGKCKAVLAGIGRQFSQDLTGDEVAGRHAGREAQDVRPVLADEADFDPSGDQGLEDGRCCAWVEGVEALVRGVADPRRELKAENGAGRKHMIRRYVDRLRVPTATAVVAWERSAVRAEVRHGGSEA